MPKRNFAHTISTGNWLVIITLSLVFAIQHINYYLEGRDVNSRVEAKELTRVTLSMQKMIDDSTTAIRLYIYTGDKKYKKIFHKIADMRMHKRSWTEEYHYYFSALDSNINYEPKRSNVYQPIDYYKSLNADDYEIALLFDIKDIYDLLFAYENNILKRYDANDVLAAKSMLNGKYYLDKRLELSEKILTLDSNIKNRLTLQTDSKIYIQRILNITICFLIISVALFIIIFYKRVLKLVLSNIVAISDWSEKIAHGEYHAELENEVFEELLPVKNSICYLANKTDDLVHQLKEIAEQDELTKLPNRRAAIQFLVQKQKEVSRYYSLCSVILIDIDFFKKINDTYGHPIGDQILINVGKLLSKHTRDSDFTARLGGEEFIVIAPQTDLSAAYMLASKLKAKIEGYIHQCSPYEIQVTISSGVSSLVADGCVEETYKEADDALYLAKSLGRNNVQVYSGSSTKSLYNDNINASC
ncbi:GGDEF domain-containing protein [Vibrio ziniensis]|uniref:diguanylate cyclase n=1 Tax=Vibrio ziniensis TaxID=2711221 RepID=A0A6G7CNR8_9VIBR|nr:GGDEF domain-containing protein [Vibrio ziniensis]QIH43739.1 GGDEF domain-containing protein [Vibrio ziniensis]